jgi:hypothetical protein
MWRWLERFDDNCKSRVQWIAGFKGKESFLKGGFLDFFMYEIQHSFICRPSDSTVSEDAGIESREGK